jgi:N-acetylmuramoyl-L-alanine amidase
MQNYQSRSERHLKHSNNFNRYWLLAIVVLVLIALVAFFRRPYRQSKSLSYTVNQTATVKEDANLYKSLSARVRTSRANNASGTVKKYYLLTRDKKQVTYAKVKLGGKTYYVNAKNLNLTMTNPVNRYVAQLGYPHAKITKRIYHKFNHKSYATASGKPRGVVVHDTGTDYSTLNGEASYMEENYKTEEVFVHTFVDSHEIRNIASLKYMAEGAGPKANPYFVQFEMIRETSARGFAKQLANAAYYTAYILKKYDLPVTKGTKSGSGTVWTHNMVSNYLGGTDHVDPNAYWRRDARRYFGTTYTIDDFIKLVQAYYNQI